MKPSAISWFWEKLRRLVLSSGEHYKPADLIYEEHFFNFQEKVTNLGLVLNPLTKMLKFNNWKVYNWTFFFMGMCLLMLIL